MGLRQASALGEDVIDKAFLGELVDDAVVDHFGCQRFGVDAFDRFEFQGRGDVARVDARVFSM